MSRHTGRDQSTSNFRAGGRVMNSIVEKPFATVTTSRANESPRGNALAIEPTRADGHVNPPRKAARAAAMLACLVLAPVLSLLSGCSVYMEATRPTPVDLSQLQPGESRDTVVAQLGIPKGTTPEADGTSCDSYELYTHGYGAGGKIP